MARENSFSDSDGRSLTPDLEDASDNEIPPDVRPPTGKTGTLAVPQSTQPAALISSPAAQTSSPAADSAGSSSRPSGVTIAEPAPPTPVTPSAPPAYPATAGARLRASVRKVILSQRMSTATTGTVGAEPGIDPRRASAFVTYGHLAEKCTIDVVDYSSLRSTFTRMDNAGFVKFLGNATASRRAPWVRVRWINIGGISWDVVSALALKYDIHPLALEDVLHQRNQSRSKADYYQKHLFIRVLCHRLIPDNGETSTLDAVSPLFTDLPRSTSPVAMHDGETDDEGDIDEKTVDGSGTLSKHSIAKSKRRSGIIGRTWALGGRHDVEKGPLEIGRKRTSTTTVKKRKAAATALTIEELKRGERVNVRTTPMCLFLFRDGTVISIHTSTDLDLTAPITARLRQRDTGLRSTADPSLLLQSLLDLVVDQALEVVDEYQRKILKLEHDVLIQPKVKTVRYLHILSGDLTLHKRTLQPIKTLVYGLRRYDVDRCNALVDSSSGGGKAVVEGFMSHKAKIYLADVHDHMEYILSSLDMFESITENLINYTFNMKAYETNEVMRRLTLATIIFLPLTLLTGYFGMNFDNMWSIMHGHSDVVFWIIALPLMSILLPIFLWRDLVSVVHFCKKRWMARRVEESLKKRQ